METELDLHYQQGKKRSQTLLIVILVSMLVVGNTIFRKK